MQFKVSSCFVGDECWCGIIVSPDGSPCNFYGEVSREDCQYIVDALNKPAGTKINPPSHPLPWHVKKFSNNSKVCIVTTKGLHEDLLEESIGIVFEEYADLFVKAVNSLQGSQ